MKFSMLGEVGGGRAIGKEERKSKREEECIMI